MEQSVESVPCKYLCVIPCTNLKGSKGSLATTTPYIYNKQENKEICLLERQRIVC